MTERKPSEALRLGWRALDGLQDLQLLGELRWNELARAWVLPCRLRATTSGPDIPEWTAWYLLAEDHYPSGQVELYPARDGGLETTNAHQALNLPGDPGLPWRTGKLCLRTELMTAGFRARPDEPWSAAARLAWHVRRALEWLEAAATGRLVLAGDDYELPELEVSGSSLIAFWEGSDTFERWATESATSGRVEMVRPPGNSNLFIALSFRDMQGRDLVQPNWGRWVRDIPPARRLQASWFRLGEVPLVQGRAPPRTWDVLAECAQRQGFDLPSFLNTISGSLRKGQTHLMLVGSRIPEVVGGPNARLHWWAHDLVFPSAANLPRGFRANAAGFARTNQQWFFARKRTLCWRASANWHPTALDGRGVLSRELRSKRIALLGVGSLGSMIAELLVRGGATQLKILDGERLVAGNLARHSLTLADVGQPKAQAVATRLAALRPNAEVEYLDAAFHPAQDQARGVVEEADLIIDCTAEKDVLDRLGRLEGDHQRVFFSASVGVHARSLLCFLARGPRFPSATFEKRTSAWVARQHQLMRGTRFPRPEVGCWHPTFPARADDVALMAATAVRALDAAIRSPPPDSRMEIYERQEDADGALEGLRRTTREDT